MFYGKRYWFPLYGIVATLFLAGADCDGLKNDPIDQAKTSCVSGQAQIAVFDGFTQNLCGCAESNAQFIHPPATLTCTVAKGTTIFVHYRGSTQRHQIRPTGTPVFPASTVYNPDEKARTGSFAFILTEAGNYAFEDAFNSSVRGTLVAN